MTDRRADSSRWYDGPVYAGVVDRLLGGLHGYLVDRLPEGDRVVDACCGTGALSRRLASSGRSVVGVDLSPRHIDYARAASASHDGPGALRFEVGDVAHLPVPDEGPYDVAVIVLALHEMPARFRGPVLGRLADVARQVVVVDFATPMPRNVAAALNVSVELAAGREHFGGFRDWQARGGVDGLLTEVGPGRAVAVASDRHVFAGTLRVTMLAAAGQPR